MIVNQTLKVRLDLAPVDFVRVQETISELSQVRRYSYIMEANFTPGDLKIELASIGHNFEDIIELPPVTYDFIVDRIMQSNLYDRKNENFINILIFHTLTRTLVTGTEMDSTMRDKLFNISVAMTQRIFKLNILPKLGQEKPHPPELDPHNPITGVNTIPRTSSLDLTLRKPQTP